MDNFFAAIDLGSNSCRLLIADKKGNTLFQENYPVKLGEGMFENCVISDAAFERAIECFTSFKKYMEEYKVTKYRAVTTAACRRAKNSEKFIKIIKEKTEIQIEIIDGYEEALLNLEGAMMNCDKSKKYVVVFDMGGGSTEVTFAANTNPAQIIYSISIPWGARNASEAFGFGKYDKGKADKLKDVINEYMKDFMVKTQYDKYMQDTCVIATSSAPLRLASMQHGFEKYDRVKADGLVIDMTKIDEVFNRYYSMSVKELAASPLVGENRSVIFIPGCIIFDTILRNNLKAEKVIASLKSAKDGIISNLIK
ncbi:MAG: hypothetical protein LBR70_03930 [Lactobacillaceae bacterium]|jgi:exopolyphosphatase/guanosine-5'-triphosphate,3'-diphosphate pyrophosphatase|nr:hypothetical protein [Lactobacillaceae bacterium]